MLQEQMLQMMSMLNPSQSSTARININEESAAGQAVTLKPVDGDNGKDFDQDVRPSQGKRKRYDSGEPQSQQANQKASQRKEKKKESC